MRALQQRKVHAGLNSAASSLGRFSQEPAHGLQSVYQAALVPAAIAFVTGDAGQAGHLAAILPGIVLQSAYSRGFEQQADDDANRELRAHGEDPGRLADLLTRLDQHLCRKQGCAPSWLGSHPATRERAARLHQAPDKRPPRR